jgi:hypothetical protein
MVSLIIHLLLGAAVIITIVVSNPQIFRQSVTPRVSVLEAVYYVAGIAATVLGYYFNYRYVNAYSHGTHNAIWGDHGSWKEFIILGYANPAAASASQDYTIMSLILLPLYTVIDGRRRGIKRAWMYLLLILFTSSAFPWAFYLATVERQRRAARAEQPAVLST